MARILIVDDEALIGLALSLLLGDSGHEVDVAPNGRSALAKARQAPPDLVITDYMMPVMDGVQLIAALRADPALRGVKVILSTSISEPSVRARTDGFDAYLMKPATDAQVLAAVARLLGDGNG
jgi:CheY-like chemotaxis protein